MTEMFKSAYSAKRVLITGNTGFKGSWLTTWLMRLGAEVIGYSKDIPTTPSMYSLLDLEGSIQHNEGDVRDLESLSRLIEQTKPDFIFHLAAQAIVSTSYDNPVETISSNAIGTMNVLEAVRVLDMPCTVVMITSDKCYRNDEWVWGYRETDALGGKDIYSGSKGAAELIIHSYVDSFFKDKADRIRIGIARAGNVIGGGDWAKDRIIADIMRSWNDSKAVEIRSPNATRPWQHVLEPLSGYLMLGQMMADKTIESGEAYNFGPRAEQRQSVYELVNDLAKLNSDFAPEIPVKVVENRPFNEAGLLKLNCDKALFDLRWEPNLSYDETIRLVGDWYSAFYEGGDMLARTLAQIERYEDIALKQERSWTQHGK